MNTSSYPKYSVDAETACVTFHISQPEALFPALTISIEGKLLMSLLNMSQTCLELKSYFPSVQTECGFSVTTSPIDTERIHLHDAVMDITRVLNYRTWRTVGNLFKYPKEHVWESARLIMRPDICESDHIEYMIHLSVSAPDGQECTVCLGTLQSLAEKAERSLHEYVPILS